MRRKPERHQPYERDEAEMIRWFRECEPRRAFSPSPQFRAKVLADVEQRRFRTGRWVSLTAWHQVMNLHAGRRVALAMGVLLALSVVVWWSVRAFGPSTPDVHHEAHRGQAQSAHATLWTTYQFQQGLQRVAALGVLVPHDTVLGEDSKEYGFTPLPARTWFFRLGTGYAEALALLQSDHRERAAQRVDGLVEALKRVQAPAELAAYLRAMQAILQSQQEIEGVLVPFLAAFEPVYEAAYTKASATEGLTYFRLGTWLANLSFAAAVGDQAGLRQGPVIQALHHALSQHGAAPVVLAPLARLQDLITQPTLTVEEIRQIHALVQELQRLLRD